MTPPMDLSLTLHTMGQTAHGAARFLANSTSDEKNEALLQMATQLIQDQEEILKANAKDMITAKANNISSSMLARLKLDKESIENIASSIRKVAELSDPVREVLKEWTRSDGLRFQKISVPIGVIAIIYESRPNVTADAAILCFKAGNACILRGGSEAFHSNTAIASSLQRGLTTAGFPSSCIQLVPNTDRAAIPILCEMDQYLNCIIPRGGKGLIQSVVRHARMPVIKHYDGICAAYIDKSADLSMTENILLNGKCERPSACNALETVLIHEKIASVFLEKAGKKLLEKGVILRCSPALLALWPTRLQQDFSLQIQEAIEEDFRTEFLSLTLALKTVSSIEEAIMHIETHGSHHSDLIITEDPEAAEIFLNTVDSATVYWNASTRFTDGGEFGFGAEIGISTDKLHARGPMGLKELTSYKYIIRGSGQTRS